MVNMGGTAFVASLLMLVAAVVGCFIAATVGRKPVRPATGVLAGTTAGSGFIIVSLFAIAGLMGR